MSDAPASADRAKSKYIDMLFDIATSLCPDSECQATGKCYGNLECKHVKKAREMVDLIKGRNHE